MRPRRCSWEHWTTGSGSPGGGPVTRIAGDCLQLPPPPSSPRLPACATRRGTEERLSGDWYQQVLASPSGPHPGTHGVGGPRIAEKGGLFHPPTPVKRSHQSSDVWTSEPSFQRHLKGAVPGQRNSRATLNGSSYWSLRVLSEWGQVSSAPKHRPLPHFPFSLEGKKGRGGYKRDGGGNFQVPK